ncbi:MAG TPA: hypothetical protein VHD56_02380 [Tepidisphaeraceae bacterium]|nr:hypothetical protein [Tepidisphaeraceae bacterium]
MNKQLLIALIAVMLGLGLWVRAQTTQPATQPAAGAPINKFCAVQKGDAIDPTITVVYKGKVIGFCCSDCPPEFNKDPEKYMKDLK